MEIPKLSAEQRMDMIMRGLSPLDQKQVDIYLKGYSLSPKDKVERAKKLFENVSSNLGGAVEREIIPDVGEEYNETKYIQDRSKPTPQSFKQRVAKDMEGYVAPQRTFATDDFVSLKESKKNSGSVLNANIENEGFEDAKMYLNLFLINLKNSDMNTSFKNRIGLYKALKGCLEKETKLKGNAEAMKKYRSGVIKAEKIMLNKLSK